MSIEIDLKRIEDQIKKAQTEKARAEGIIISNRERLKKEFGIETDEAAGLELTRLSQEINEINKGIQQNIDYLKNTFPHLF